MAKYFIQDTTLKNIADAIRAKSGKSAPMTLDEMPVEIGALSAEEQLKASEYPEYIHPEVLDIASKVASVRKDESIVFIAMSDSHYPANESGIYYGENTTKSALQANQAAKVLTYLLKPDFAAHLGDVGAGADSTTPDMIKSQIDGFLDYFREASSDIPVFIAIGNHDTNTYYHKGQNSAGNTGDYITPGEWLYENFTAHSASSDTVIDGEEYGGYCYRDFADKKLRVFLLNTSEKLVGAPIEKYETADQATYGAQRVWFANALLNLNSKADASDWGFIVLCHYPADYAEAMPLSNLFEAYVNGKSFTITDPVSSYYVGDGTSQTVNFAGKNSAKFLAQFHGHIHNFLASRLHSNASGSPVQYDAWRICVPNGEAIPDRHNYYGTFGDINFMEEQTYPKTVDTVNGTSFVVNVINPSEELIYSFCYGAGYDRVVGIAETVYYSISADLTNVALSNSAVSIEEGKSYTATLAYDEAGYYFDEDSVTVTMGGNDITSSAYADGVITIPSVTGNVVITASATQRGGYTNQIPLATSAFNGTEIYNAPYGFKEGTRLNSSNSLSSVSGMCTTGFIPVKIGDVVRFKNVTISGSASSYILTYGNNGGYLGVRQISELGSPDADGVYTWNITAGTGFENTQAMRVSIGVIDETSIITVNEEII